MRTESNFRSRMLPNTGSGARGHVLNDDEDDLESFTVLWPFFTWLLGDGINSVADYRPWRLAREILQPGEALSRFFLKKEMRNAARQLQACQKLVRVESGHRWQG